VDRGVSDRGQQLKARIREWAGELGFTSIGFGPAVEPRGAREGLLSWLAGGNHGAMAWMARNPERRVDPAAILPEARSVIVVTLQYLGPPSAADLAPARIARYARGEDYHVVVGDKLHALTDRIRVEHPALRARIACDTSPVAEKAWAVQAGVGWLGKNTCVLNPTQGSWFFLGELFVDLELPPDPPVTDLCGSCTRCLDACPTGAFPAPYQLDARRCISYWTLEHRGTLPEGAEDSMPPWLGGCDICQEVCPWNRKAPVTDEPRLAERAELVERSVEAWASISDDEYRALVRPTALSRIKPDDLRRNARAILRASERSDETST